MQRENQYVDILLATYNGALYLEELLSSIKSQTYKYWRLIIRDDGSGDDSLQIAKRTQMQLGKGKVLIFKNDVSTGSAKANFFNLIKDAESQYIMFCDQDDVWNPDKIEITLKRMKAIERKSDFNLPILVYTDLKVVDENLTTISESFRKYMKLPPKVTLENLLIQNSVTGCAVMINAALCNEMKQIDNTDQVLMHDHWAAILACVFGKIGYINITTINYRQHGNNSVGASDAQNIKYFYQRFKRGKKAFRRDMKKSVEQIQYFYEMYQEKIMDDKMKKLIKKYADLTRRKKLSRIIYYFKYHVFKYGLIKKIVQIVWG